jgi:hypothetical protein
MAGFGYKVKDEPIQQFYTSNRAYELTASQGFRTFIQSSRSSSSVYEPFGPVEEVSNLNLSSCI